VKIWTNNKFTGHYPVGVGAVVVAENAGDAADYLSLFLNEVGLENAKITDMEEMPFVEGQVKILADGNY
jgi:hypothetical protein